MSRELKICLWIHITEEEAIGLIEGDDYEGPPFTSVAGRVASEVYTLALQGFLGDHPLKVAKKRHTEGLRRLEIMKRQEQGLACDWCGRNLEGETKFPITYPNTGLQRFICAGCEQERKEGR